MRIVTIDGKAYRLRDILDEYKRQKAAQRTSKQLTLFELREDARPASQRTAAGRHSEPLLF